MSKTVAQLKAASDHSHLDALELSLSHERSRLRAARSKSEKDQRTVWVAQLEKEIASERKFLGMSETDKQELSDEEILSELGLS